MNTVPKEMQIDNDEDAFITCIKQIDEVCCYGGAKAFEEMLSETPIAANDDYALSKYSFESIETFTSHDGLKFLRNVSLVLSYLFCVKENMFIGEDCLQEASSVVRHVYNHKIKDNLHYFSKKSDHKVFKFLAVNNPVPCYLVLSITNSEGIVH